ncbi:nicotinate-nucleotide--dimethylbenzimidazole phosphoribosyltransferase [Pseudoroseicyclus tamaricis]|uniref:Nicotinate-nucleotide--dimethylbenzimidazole phosphoribosyltransferase n=1 Tax=Pseudoroseicyclus tamaricis TaxID=2705421 RepID=A0A6B2JGU4_9RHOB|nr:nicotinate-nucleotide--dimethylbenzimidazole phosphoribosyltransferase [Pseudoroseicyclus tamaricis]NDV00393.1 nicotinate-nucleotide--dimethylbenzimidazole phosphoribosyltransferase [Pseudoroseicyclus tamaricis]
MPVRFTDLAGIRAALADLPQPDAAALAGASARNAQLTKPPASLGRLEELAIWYAGWRSEARPAMRAPLVCLFAGNHGVAARGVSAFPPEVTAQMVGNFEAGGAAINQLAGAFGARLSVTPLSLESPTADFTQGPAMSEAEVVEAFATGWAAVDPAADLLVTGEMGIGNTTAAAALSAALFGGGGEAWVGRGTGVDDAGLARKREVVDAGLAAHAGALDDPLEVLRRLGGRELAAMAGAILAARHHRIPVILDGFICCASAAVLAKAAPGALEHCVAGHSGAEAAHARLLEALGLTALLDLELRLGEGSGAALAIGVLKGALACHSGMATFAEAGVSAG